MIEEWKEIEGFSKYEVSNTGKIREKESLREIPQPLNNNYLCVNMYRDDGVKVLCKVHRIVALAFIPNTENVHNVDHKEGRLDNSVGNLQWRPKKVKEVKPEKTLTFLDKNYTYEEFCVEAGCEISTLKERLKASWTIRECYTGIKAPRNGYEDGSYWYPTKWVYEETMKQVKLEKPRTEKEEKNKQNALKRAEKKATVHHGFGIFTNYPIKGIEGRKPHRMYYVWQGIIARCYNPEHDSYERYGARGCTVSEKWKHFQDFAIWYQEQQKRGLGNTHINWHVDKDILVEGNLEYGPETCCFVPDDVNIFFASFADNTKGCWLHKGSWRSSVSILGSKLQRGFKTEEEALKWYKDGKSQAAKLLLWKYGGLLEQRVVNKLSQI